MSRYRFIVRVPDLVEVFLRGPRDPQYQLVTWIKCNVRGGYDWQVVDSDRGGSSTLFRFEDARDAVLFRLTWVGFHA